MRWAAVASITSLSKPSAQPEAGGIAVHIILNKIDVAAKLAQTRQRLALYAGLGYPIHEVSAQAEPEAEHGDRPLTRSDR